MRIDILTILPSFFNDAFTHSILKRAIEKDIVEIHIHDIRKHSTQKQKSVDDYQFGGGAGMVMCIQPIDDCINELKTQRNYDEIIHVGSGKGVTSVSAIKNTKWRRKSFQYYRILLKIYQQAVMKCPRYNG